MLFVRIFVLMRLTLFHIVLSSQKHVPQNWIVGRKEVERIENLEIWCWSQMEKHHE